MDEKRWFLDQDDSSHWYLVPLKHRDEWNAWLELDPDDEASWDAPDWAHMLGSGPQILTFTGPERVV